jgi:hypothetical protein
LTLYTTKIVENAVQAKGAIEELIRGDYTEKQIYLFAHDKHRSEDITDATHTEKVGLTEQGLLESLGNVFKSRGDELRDKMTSIGLSQSEANLFEEELDKGRLVLVASHDE